MPEVIVNDLLTLAGDGIDTGSLGTVYTYSEDPTTNDLTGVLDGLTFTTPDDTPGEIIPLGSTVTLDGTDYELTEVYSFWGSFSVVDPDTGDTFTNAGQTVGATLTDSAGNEVNVIGPSDSFTSGPAQWTPGDILAIEVQSEPFETDAIYEDEIGSKLGDDEPITPPCFVTGSLVDTDQGPKPVEQIVAGDLVLTRDNGYQPVMWAGQKHMNAAELAMHPEFRAVIVRAGALGGGLPVRDMRVSPWHRLLLCGQRAELMFGEYEVLVPAIHMVGQPGIERDSAAQTYVHLLFEDHQIVRADGAWSESFQPGAKTLAGIGDAQRDEIFALFPELADAAGQEGYVAARLSLKPHEVRALLAA